MVCSENNKELIFLMVNSGEVWIVHEGVGVSVSLELGRGGDMVLSLCHQTGAVAEGRGVSISS